MKVNQKVDLHNRFDIEIKNIETGEVREYVAHNIILDRMWSRLCDGSSYFTNIHFGTGLGTPLASRTSLFTHLGTKTAVDEELIKAVPVSTWKRKIVLKPEEYVGSTITEVGIAFGSTASNLVTHAMLKDSEGNTISITKSNTDVVTIYATVFVTLNTLQNDLIYVGLPNNNQLINYLVGGGFAPSGDFGLNELPYSYSRLGSSPSAAWSSDIPNKQRKTNVVRFGTTAGNGNVRALDFSNLFSLKLPSTGVFNGQSYVNIPLGVGDGVKTEFELPSLNIKQNSIGVKINGVVTEFYSKVTKNKYPARIANPSSLPSGASYGVALTPDGLVMAVAHDNSPCITTYDWVGGAWVKRPNPSSLPSGASYGVALTPDGLVMAVAHDNSPCITTYDWVGGAWVKRPNPSSLPSGDGYGVALTPDGLVMAVAHYYSPYITTYENLPATTIKFDTPPTVGEVITADYTVEGIYKTDQYVVDVSFAIQFGEGV